MHEYATRACSSPSPGTWAGGLPLLLQDRVASYIYGPGGQILEQVQGTNAYYYHADQLGSVRALTDQSKAVVATYSYDAYGQPTASTGSIANPFRYAGQYRDAESGLYYLRARYYDPTTQQFLTVDPLLAATEQAYAYAAGSPLNTTDPSGLWVVCGFFSGSIDVGAMGTGTFYHCIDQLGHQGMLLWSYGLQASISGGAAISPGLLAAPSAQSICDLYGWSIGGGASFTPTGKSLGVTADIWYSKSSGWYAQGGGTIGPNVGLPLGEGHVGLSNTAPITPVDVILARVQHVVASLPPAQWLDRRLHQSESDWERSYQFQQYQRSIGVSSP
jgi:RHS repeat-associated protein